MKNLTIGFIAGAAFIIYLPKINSVVESVVDKLQTKEGPILDTEIPPVA